MNIDYSQFYRGTTNIPSYGSGAYKKDTLVKYEFNTTDEHGNKVMDKMSREETLQAMKDIRSQYGDSVIVEFSGDGLAALAEDRRDSMSPEDREAMEERKTSENFMVKLASFIVNKRKAFIALFALACIYSAISIPKVGVINDLTEYLPESTETRQGLDIMNEEFTTFGTAKVLVSNITYQKALKLAGELEEYFLGHPCIGPHRL